MIEKVSLYMQFHFFWKSTFFKETIFEKPVLGHANEKLILSEIKSFRRETQGGNP